MANRCVACDGPLDQSIECQDCGHIFYCSIPCTFTTPHPCILLRCLQWTGEEMVANPFFVSQQIHQLDQRQCICLGRLYDNPGLPRSVLAHLIEHAIPGKVFLCLFQIAAVHDIWPHLAVERRSWIERMANLLSHWQPILDPCSQLKNWTRYPELFVPLFMPFVDKNADLFIACFDTTYTWKYIFSDEEPYLFLLRLLKNASSIPEPLKKSITSLKIGRGRGGDLVMFGRYIQLPLTCANYETASASARMLKLPMGMYFVFDRLRWETARKIYLRWLEHRDTLFFVFSIAEYTKLATLIDYSWLGL